MNRVRAASPIVPPSRICRANSFSSSAESNADDFGGTGSRISSVSSDGNGFELVTTVILLLSTALRLAGNRITSVVSCLLQFVELIAHLFNWPAITVGDLLAALEHRASGAGLQRLIKLVETNPRPAKLFGCLLL